MTRKSGAAAPRAASTWLFIFLLLIVSAFLVWRIVRTSTADAMIKTNPVAVAVVAPDDPRLAMSMAMLEFRATGGRVRPKVREAAMNALRRAPLADEPFFLAGITALIDHDEASADRLLTEARRRNPRSRYVRLLLLDRYLRSGKVVDATAEMNAIGNLIPNSTQILTAELARLVQTPATGPALIRALKRNPEPRDPLLEYLAGSGASPDLILRIAREVPAPPQAQPGAPAWQAKLISSLVDRGQVDRAYQLWRTFSNPRAPARKEGLFDPNFRGLPGLPPFNWYYPDTSAGAAERSASGLQIDYYGRDDAELAGQLLMLAPGRYRLSFVAEGGADGESSRLSWKVECLQSKASLGEFILRKLTYAPRRLVGEFTVPAQACSGQRLRLLGTSGEFAKAQNATIRDFGLTRVP